MADTLEEGRRVLRRLREELVGPAFGASPAAARRGDPHDVLPPELAAPLPHDAWLIGARGAPLGSIDADAPCAVVVLRDVYVRTPRRAARVALLQRASALACGRPLFVHAPVSPQASALARLVIDLPRGLASAIGRPLAREPGDRHDRGAPTHLFFGEEPLLREVEDAGLTVVGRWGFWLELAPSSTASAWEHARSTFSAEIARAWALRPRVEAWRRDGTVKAAIEQARARGRGLPRRDEVGRARLRRAISWVDHLPPYAPNCLRRVLLESALDAGAAADLIALALDVGATGHAYFPSREEATLDVTFVI